MKDLTNVNVPTAFKEMLIWEIPTMKKFAKNFMSNKEDADDLLQDTLLKAMLSFSRFEPGTNFRAWLYVMMRNLFVNFYRKQKLAYERSKHEGECLMQPSFTLTGDDKFLRKDILTALDKLNPHFSAPLAMYIKGYKYREIATGLKCPIGTIKTRIHVARRILKDELMSYQPACA